MNREEKSNWKTIIHVKDGKILQHERTKIYNQCLPIVTTDGAQT